jgi:hypothetical protein
MSCKIRYSGVKLNLIIFYKKDRKAMDMSALTPNEGKEIEISKNTEGFRDIPSKPMSSVRVTV